jgi:predicted AAA+ superfamily ATPase
MFVRRLQDSNYKFFITGSNASLLSQELGTRLTGRNVIHELYPFSFREYLKYKNYQFEENHLFNTKTRGFLKGYFNEYLKNGGIPEYLKFNEQIILKKIYEDILYRDIIVRHDLKEVKSIRELGLYLLSNVTCLYSYNKLKILLELGSVNTIKSYIEYFENSYLLFSVTKFDYSLKKQFIANKKIYCIDSGIIEAISFAFMKNSSHFLENLVFLEQKRNGKEIYYYNTKSGFEVDFLIKKESKIESLIQVSSEIKDKKTKDREIRSLISAMNELNLDKSFILTTDTEETINIDKKTIIIKPVYKWLIS